MGKDQRSRTRGARDDMKLRRQNRNDRAGDKDSRRAREIADTAEEMISKKNDYKWYSKFPQFTKDAGTLAFGIPLGQQIQLTPSDLITIPGIMKLMYMPGIGHSEDLASPVNRMAMRFYTYLRDVQKAAAKYDAADIMMYLMSIDSLIAFHSLMRRAYGVAQLYTPVNKYYPRNLLQFMGFDPTISDNLAEFRAYINRFALAIGSYCMPKDFDICVRHKWMNEGLYLDSNTTRAQTYMFVPEGFWRFNNTVSTGSQLDFVRWQQAGTSHTLHTLDQVQSFGDSMLNAILGDQDTGNISGDLYAKYGPGGLMKLEETPEQFSVMPVYNETVLTQIENATVCGEIVGSPTISQNPTVNNGAIVFTPSFDFGNFNGSAANTYVPSVANWRPINMHVDSPGPEAVIEATRLSVCFQSTPPQGDSAQFFPDVFGSDIVTRLWIGVLNTATPQALSSIYSKSNLLDIGTGATTAQLTGRIQFISLLASFDWAPDYWLGQVSAGTVDYMYPGFDADNLTVVSATQLKMMHEASLLSMLDVPQMGM